MGNLDSKSNLIWCGVSVLQQACKNSATHKALIHTYQFLPILSRLLGDHLTREKKIKLLTLMQVSASIIDKLRKAFSSNFYLLFAGVNKWD